MLKRFLAVSAAVAALGLATATQAGPVFLTGHDPDFHAQGQTSGVDELQIALNFVTGGTYAGGSQKFLWVESHLPVLGGHRVGENALTGALGLTQGTNFDWVDASGLGAVNFNNYSAIVVASSFGGMLSAAEINALTARSSAIATYVNGGGGLAAFAECGVGFADCDPTLTPLGTPLFGFVPVSSVSVSTAPPYTLTPYGVSLGFTTFDANDCCTHNSFGATPGLNVVDFDQNGNPTTLAGNVRIGGGGFTGTPEPAAWALMIAGFGLAGAGLRRRTARLA